MPFPVIMADDPSVSDEAPTTTAITPTCINASHFDARGSRFNHIQGDQTNHFHSYIFVGQDQSHQIPTLQSPIAGPSDVTPWPPLSNHSYALGDLKESLQLIAEIVPSLDRASAYSALGAELELLEYTLKLTGLGIDAYRGTQLGCNLAKTINPELVHCRGMLQKLLCEINHYRQTLWYTPIRLFWHLVFHWSVKLDELGSGSRRETLSRCRNNLGIFVMALHSWVLLLPHC
jgi:hypothetical protein